MSVIILMDIDCSSHSLTVTYDTASHQLSRLPISAVECMWLLCPGCGQLARCVRQTLEVGLGREHLGASYLGLEPCSHQELDSLYLPLMMQSSSGQPYLIGPLQNIGIKFPPQSKCRTTLYRVECTVDGIEWQVSKSAYSCS